MAKTTLSVIFRLSDEISILQLNSFSDQFSRSTNMDLAIKIVLQRGNTDTQLVHLFIKKHIFVQKHISQISQTSAWPFFMDATRGVLFRESLAW